MTVDGGTIAASGSIAIESLSGAAMTVFDGARISAPGMSVGARADESGSLMVSGAETSIQNTAPPDRCKWTLEGPDRSPSPVARC